MRVFAPLDRRNPVHRGSARLSAWLLQDAVADAMLAGRFTRLLGRRPDDIVPGKYHDYLGLNYCSRTASSRLTDGTLPGVPVNDLGWEIHPEGLVACARQLHERYGGPVWVTENGTCDNGDPARGALERFRCRYVADHLDAIGRSGLPFERYHHWCFVDNWEWREGEAARFGIVHNDYASQERTVKPSGHFLARVIADGGITAAARTEFVAGQRYDRASPAR